MRFLVACLSLLAAPPVLAAPTEGPAAAEPAAARQPSKGELQRQLAEVRRRQISALRKLIQENPHHPKKADLRFRLAEKLWAEAEYTRCVDQGDCSP